MTDLIVETSSADQILRRLLDSNCALLKSYGKSIIDISSKLNYEEPVNFDWQ